MITPNSATPSERRKSSSVPLYTGRPYSLRAKSAATFDGSTPKTGQLKFSRKYLMTTPGPQPKSSTLVAGVMNSERNDPSACPLFFQDTPEIYLRSSSGEAKPCRSSDRKSVG